MYQACDFRLLREPILRLRSVTTLMLASSADCVNISISSGSSASWSRQAVVPLFTVSHSRTNFSGNVTPIPISPRSARRSGHRNGTRHINGALISGDIGKWPFLNWWKRWSMATRSTETFGKVTRRSGSPDRVREPGVGEPLGKRPESCGHGRVPGGGGTLDELRCPTHVREIARSGEAVAGQVGDGRVQDGQGALLGGLCHQPDEELGQAAAAGVDLGRDEAGMGRLRQHCRARLVEAALELGGEEQVGQLGPVVGPGRLVGVVLVVGVVEVDAADSLGL